MISFYIYDKLKFLKTFPTTINLKDLNNIKIESEHGAIFQNENLNILANNPNDKDLYEALSKSINKVKLSGSSIDFWIKKFFFLDYYYLNSSIYKLYKILK